MNIVPVLARDDEYYWRLAYFDGSVRDEPAQGGSIKVAPANASTLFVMKRGMERPLWRIPIPEGGKPVWYRKRSMDVYIGDAKRNGGVRSGPARTDATVFGFVMDGGNELKSKLWMLAGDRTVNVPDEFLDQSAIEGCWLRE